MDLCVSTISKKQKTSGAFLDQSIEQLNDVTAVSGVNLKVCLLFSLSFFFFVWLGGRSEEGMLHIYISAKLSIYKSIPVNYKFLYYPLKVQIVAKIPLL